MLMFASWCWFWLHKSKINNFSMTDRYCSMWNLNVTGRYYGINNVCYSNHFTQNYPLREDMVIYNIAFYGDALALL